MVPTRAPRSGTLDGAPDGKPCKAPRAVDSRAERTVCDGESPGGRDERRRAPTHRPGRGGDSAAAAPAATLRWSGDHDEASATRRGRRLSDRRGDDASAAATATTRSDPTTAATLSDRRPRRRSATRPRRRSATRPRRRLRDPTAPTPWWPATAATPWWPATAA